MALSMLSVPVWQTSASTRSPKLDNQTVLTVQVVALQTAPPSSSSSSRTVPCGSARKAGWVWAVL